jgi:hypothetical protein
VVLNQQLASAELRRELIGGLSRAPAILAETLEILEHEEV